MGYRITGLAPAPFSDLFGLSEEALRDRGVQRLVVDAKPGFPDRIELRDLDVGETALLLNFTHQPAKTPYRASHAIFVREGAVEAAVYDNQIPEVMRVRPLSLRAFSADHMMVDADLVEGHQAEAVIERFLQASQVSYIQAHYAKRGCYAARIERI